MTKLVRDEKSQKWVVNDTSNGLFDGIILAVGTCGDPKIPHIPGQEDFKGEIHHSSKLDGKNAEGKKVAIIGGGASAVEALEFVASSGAEKAASVLSRISEICVLRRVLAELESTVREVDHSS